MPRWPSQATELHALSKAQYPRKQTSQPISTALRPTPDVNRSWPVGGIMTHRRHERPLSIEAKSFWCDTSQTRWKFRRAGKAANPRGFGTEFCASGSSTPAILIPEISPRPSTLPRYPTPCHSRSANQSSRKSGISHCFLAAPRCIVPTQPFESQRVN